MSAQSEVRDFIEAAVRARHPDISDYHLKVLMNVSMEFGAEGFDRQTLWDALALAATPNEGEGE